MKKKILLIFIALISSPALGKESYSDTISYSLGMVNHSVTPNESSLVATDETTETTDEAEAAAAAVSAISLQVNYEFKTYAQKSYFMAGTFPVMTSEGTGVYSGNIGMNWYFGDLGTRYSYTNNGKTMTITPKSRYYWGASTGVGYVVYNTESAKFTDVFFDLGLHLGAGWAWGKKRAIKVEAGASRATGINTTGIRINAFLGMTSYL